MILSSFYCNGGEEVANIISKLEGKRVEEEEKAERGQESTLAILRRLVRAGLIEELMFRQI